MICNLQRILIYLIITFWTSSTVPDWCARRFFWTDIFSWWTLETPQPVCNDLHLPKEILVEPTFLEKKDWQNCITSRYDRIVNVIIA